MAIAGYANLGVTVATLVEETIAHLSGSRRGALNKMNDAGGISAVDATVTFEFEANGIRAGAYIEIDDEVMYVHSVTGFVATIERAQLGSTAAIHADDSMIRVMPRYARVDVLRALAREVGSWPPEIYTVLRGELTVPAGYTSIDLDGATLRPGLRFLGAWRPVDQGGTYPDRWPRVNGVQLHAEANLDAYPSGYRLVWPMGTDAGDYQVAVGAPMDVDPFISSTDVGAIGLSRSMLDIPPLGAAARLLLGKEAERTDASAAGRSKPAEEVPPGYTSRTASDFRADANRRLAEEAMRLVNDHPWRF